MDNEKNAQTKENRNVVINSETPETLTNNIYTPAFLRENIGKLMRVEFLIGTNNLVDRTGILIDVGASYILLRALESDVITYADLYSIIFLPARADRNVLCVRGEAFYNQNKGLDKNGDGKITKSDLAKHLSEKYVDESVFA